jgi:hypothetical protein
MRERNMRARRTGFIVALISALLIGISASAAVTDNVKEPFSQDVWVPCANGGVGELLTISGRLHILFTETFDAAGGAHFTFHFQPQGASGIGSVTGDVYRAVGKTGGSTHIGSGGLPFIDTFVNNFYMIGTGGGVNFKLHNTVHVTVNANGELSANVDNSSVTCS